MTLDVESFIERAAERHLLNGVGLGAGHARRQNAGDRDTLGQRRVLFPRSLIPVE